MTDQEIEDFLAEKVMGWHLRRICDLANPLFDAWIGSDEFVAEWKDSWHPLKEISQAWQILEKCTDPKGLGLQCNAQGHEIMSHFMWHFQEANLWAYSAEEAAREISLIAVKCVAGSAEIAQEG